MKLPVPENPLHVENLKTVELLEFQGWKGPDESIWISIDEYHFLYREVGDELLVIYRASHGHNYDRLSIKLDLDLYKEYNWIHWDSVYSYLGLDKESFDSAPLWQKLYDLVSYHGVEEIFGTTYWEGFKIYPE